MYTRTFSKQEALNWISQQDDDSMYDLAAVNPNNAMVITYIIEKSDTVGIEDFSQDQLFELERTLDESGWEYLLELIDSELDARKYDNN